MCLKGLVSICSSLVDLHAWIRDDEEENTACRSLCDFVEQLPAWRQLEVREHTKTKLADI